MQQVHPEKLFIRKTGGYWMRTLYVAVVVVVGMGGFMLGGVDASSGFLANIQEAWGDIFGDSSDGVVEVLEVDEFVPGELDSGADRIVEASGSSGNTAKVSPVSSREVAACSFETEVTPTREGVLLSEIAWMGGLDSEGLTHADEWVEIANITKETVDISGWQLLDKKGDIEIIFPDQTFIAPGGFLLLERTDDDTVPGIEADFVYVGALSNQDEGLRLFSEDCVLVDEALADPTWPAGDATSRQTMERSPDLGWHTFTGDALEGIYGTPKGENSLPPTEEVEEEIFEEETEEEDQEEEVALCTYGGGSPSYKVLINEVAWAGQSGNPSGEWIELKNNTGGNTSLGGWQLLDQDGSIKVLFDEGDKISSYLLLRRALTGDDPDDLGTVGGKKADKTYTGILQNSNETLYLFDGNCNLVDEVAGGSNWEGIGGSASPEYRTAERTDVTSWHTYAGDGSGGVMGTPRSLNSTPWSRDVVPTQGGGGGGGGGVPDTVEISWCDQGDLTEPTRLVLINEVSWAGRMEATSEEWVELTSKVEGSLSLEGWQLLNQKEDIKISLEGNIEEFLLLRRILASEDSGTVYLVGGVEADVVYTGTLLNSDETLRLFDASCNLVDEVVDVGTEWVNVGGTVFPEYRTAERVDDTTWQTYLGEGTDGIMGTPRAENSVAEDPGSENDGDSEEEVEEDAEEEIIEEVVICEWGNDSESLGTVFINEVAWMGGSTAEGLSHFDEWIELKNVSGEEISVTGWQLKDVGGDIEVIFPGGVLLAPSEFLLLERTDDDSVPGVVADVIYTGSLANNSESLRLFNQDCVLIDEALANPDWLAGDNASKRTMERSADSGWHTFDGEPTNGIYGTPRAPNSEPFKEEEDSGEE
ncbi:MAG: lamin tail domain-containing protein [bacterium]|nr:lamin tail domain-containing protein [bacterium]